MQQRHNHKKGFSLVEAAIVLGVVGLVIGGIWVAAASVKQRWFETKFSEGFLLFVQKTQRYLTQSDTCAGGFLVYSSPELWRLIYPKQWDEINVGARLGDPTLDVHCDTDDVRWARVTFWSVSDYLCSALMPNISTQCTRIGCQPIELLDYRCENHGNVEIFMPLPSR
jgi:type II secretory pathway pseudopilin PulG